MWHSRLFAREERELQGNLRRGGVELLFGLERQSQTLLLCFIGFLFTGVLFGDRSYACCGAASFRYNIVAHL